MRKKNKRALIGYRFSFLAFSTCKVGYFCSSFSFSPFCLLAHLLALQLALCRVFERELRDRSYKHTRKAQEDLER